MYLGTGNKKLEWILAPWKGIIFKKTDALHSADANSS